MIVTYKTVCNWMSIKQNCHRSTFLKQTLALSAATTSQELSNLNISGKCHHPMVNWAMKLLHASTQSTYRRLNSKIYSSVNCPVTPYGCNCWPTTKGSELCFATMKTNILRGISGAIPYDNVQNEDTLDQHGVGLLVEKLEEAHIQLYGHDSKANRNNHNLIR